MSATQTTKATKIICPLCGAALAPTKVGYLRGHGGTVAGPLGTKVYGCTASLKFPSQV